MSRPSLWCLLLLAHVVVVPWSSRALEAQSPGDRTPDDSAALRRLHATLEFVRGRNARDYAIPTPAGIDEGRFVRLGGIEQWITVRGEDRRNPVILFLHGGPGDASNLYSYPVFRSWLRTFTVVQWDQRGAGRTLQRNGPGIASTITVDRLVQDGVELAAWLRDSLRQEKVIVVGHSWGSILGAMMAKRRPALFHAFVGTGQVADPARNYAVAYDDVLAAAQRRGEGAAVRELREVGAPPWRDGRGFAVQRKWSNMLEGADTFLGAMIGLALGAPGGSARDVTDWLDGQGVSAERLVPETSALSPAAIGGAFEVPVVVIQGEEDFTTPTRLARDWVDSLRAPRKAFVTLAGAGHFALFMQPTAFLRALTEQLVPVVPSLSRPR